VLTKQRLTRVSTHQRGPTTPISIGPSAPGKNCIGTSPDAGRAKRMHRRHSFQGLIPIHRRRNVSRAKVITNEQQLRVQCLGQCIRERIAKIQYATMVHAGQSLEPDPGVNCRGLGPRREGKAFTADKARRSGRMHADFIVRWRPCQRVRVPATLPATTSPGGTGQPRRPDLRLRLEFPGNPGASGLIALPYPR
jgi:hypothetical protein